jgi:multicomponent Na+:H+ antiporter subunit F
MRELFLSVGIALTVLTVVSGIRCLIGPTLPDRVVGLDTVNTLIIAVMVILSVAFEQVIFVDIAIVYALLSYVTTLYIAKYLEGGL